MNFNNSTNLHFTLHEDIPGNVFENATVIISVTGKYQELTYLNRTWVSFTGCTCEEEIGFRWEAKIHQENQPPIFASSNPFFYLPETLKVKSKMNRSDHHYRWILIKRKPSSSDKYFLGLFGACSDNNELKMLVIPNDECINADRPALKTPVPSTTLCPHILEEQLKKTGENQELNYSEKEGNHLDKLSKLINDTPDVSGKSVHEIAFEDHEIAYDDLITKVVNNSWTNITSHRIVLSGKTAKNTGIRSWSGVIIKSDMIKDQGEKIW